MNRIYHHYEKWEDNKHGLYLLKDEKKEENIIKNIELLKNIKELEKYMNKVIKEWKYSCEQNLSNTTMNRQAYLGQSACCLHHGSPAVTTRSSWVKLNKDEQDKANKTADKIIKKWENKYERV